MPETRKNSLEESRIRDIVSEEIRAVLQAELKTAFSDFNHRLDQIMSDFTKELKLLREEVEEKVQRAVCAETKEMRKRLEAQEYEMARMQKFLFEREKESLKERRSGLAANLVVSGVEEAESETPEQLLQSVQELVRSINADVTIVSAVRIGRNNGRGPRLTKVATSSQDARNQVLKCSKSLKDIQRYKNIFINPDRCHIDRIENSRLRKAMRDLKKSYPQKRIALSKGKLWMDGEIVDFEKPLSHVFSGFSW